MKRKFLGLATATVALTLLTGAFAFNWGQVWNPAHSAIVESDSALLAMVPGTEHPNLVTIDANNRLDIDLTKGNTGYVGGMQNGSEYAWNKLFYVKNNNECTIRVEANLNAQNGPDQGTLTTPKGFWSVSAEKKDGSEGTQFGLDGPWVQLVKSDGLSATHYWQWNTPPVEANYIDLDPGEEAWIGMQFTTAYQNFDIGQEDFTLTFQARKIQSSNPE